MKNGKLPGYNHIGKREGPGTFPGVPLKRLSGKLVHEFFKVFLSKSILFVLSPLALCSLTLFGLYSSFGTKNPDICLLEVFLTLFDLHTASSSCGLSPLQLTASSPTFWLSSFLHPGLGHS
jgi:hypothetical protein